MAESPVLASQFRPVAQFWLERYLDTVEVSGSSPLGPTIIIKALRATRTRNIPHNSRIWIQFTALLRVQHVSANHRQLLTNRALLTGER